MQEGGYIRRCTKCGATNREVKFNRYRKICQPCDRERVNEWRAANPEKMSAYAKARWQKTKSNPEKLRAEYDRGNEGKRRRYRESADIRYSEKERLRDYREKKRVEARVRAVEISEAAG